MNHSYEVFTYVSKKLFNKEMLKPECG